MAKLLATKPAKAVAIAVANKLARIALIGMFKAQLRKLILIEKLENAEPEARDFDETYRTADEFLENFYKIWGSDDPADRNLFPKQAFIDPIPYYRNRGY